MEKPYLKMIFPGGNEIKVSVPDRGAFSQMVNIAILDQLKRIGTDKESSYNCDPDEVWLYSPNAARPMNVTLPYVKTLHQKKDQPIDIFEAE